MDFDREMELEDAGIDAFEFSLMDDDERREVLADAGLEPDDYDMIELDSSFDAWERLQSAGMSLAGLRIMDDDERRRALADAGLDPDDYDDSAPLYIPRTPMPPVPPKPAPTPAPKPKPAPMPAARPAPNPKPAADPAPKPKPAADPAPGPAAKPGPAPKPKPKPAPKPKPDPAPKPGPEESRVRPFCQVRFSGSDTLYSYWAEGLELQVGDRVVVPVGDRGDRAVVTVAVTGSCAEADAPYPAERMKSVERPAGPEEQERLPAEPAPEKKAEPAAEPEKVPEKEPETVPEPGTTGDEPLPEPGEAEGSDAFGGRSFEKLEKLRKRLGTAATILGVLAAMLALIVGIVALNHRSGMKRFRSGLEHFENESYNEAYVQFQEAGQFGISKAEPYVELCLAGKDAEKRMYNDSLRRIDEVIQTEPDGSVTQDARRFRAEVEEKQARFAAECAEKGMAAFGEERYAQAVQFFTQAMDNGGDPSFLPYLIYSRAELEFSDHYYGKAQDLCSQLQAMDCDASLRTKAARLTDRVRQAEREAEQERKARQEEADRKMRQYLRDKLPYVGMSTKYLNDTALGKATYDGSGKGTLDGETVTVQYYSYHHFLYPVYDIRCVDGKVIYVSRRSSSTRPLTISPDDDDEDADEYYADEFASAADFYEYYRDDFYDFDEAEDYYYSHGGW